MLVGVLGTARLMAISLLDALLDPLSLVLVRLDRLEQLLDDVGLRLLRLLLSKPPLEEPSRSCGSDRGAARP